MEDLSIVLVCVFCAFFIMVLVYVAKALQIRIGIDFFSIGAITSSRRRALRARAVDPGPKQLLRARRKLSTVTAMSTMTRDTRDTCSPDVEATAAQIELREWCGSPSFNAVFLI